MKYCIVNKIYTGPPGHGSGLGQSSVCTSSLHWLDMLHRQVYVFTANTTASLTVGDPMVVAVRNLPTLILCFTDGAGACLCSHPWGSVSWCTLPHCSPSVEKGHSLLNRKVCLFFWPGHHSTVCCWDLGTNIHRDLYFPCTSQCPHFRQIFFFFCPHQITQWWKQLIKWPLRRWKPLTASLRKFCVLDELIHFALWAGYILHYTNYRTGQIEFLSKLCSCIR